MKEKNRRTFFVYKISKNYMILIAFFIVEIFRKLRKGLILKKAIYRDYTLLINFYQFRLMYNQTDFNKL